MRATPLLIFIFQSAFFFLGPAPAWSQSSGDQVLTEIKNAYNKIEFELAEQRILSALERYDLFTASQLTEIHKTLGLIKYSQNDLIEAKKQFEAALRLTPQLQLDALQTSPKVIAFFSQTAAEIATEKASVNPESINYIFVEDVRPAAAFRSMILPGWGQHYKGQKRKGYVLMGMWGATTVGTIIAHSERTNHKTAYLAVAPDNPSLIEEKYRVYDGWHRARNNLFIASVGIWIYAYVDALSTSRPAIHQFHRNRVRVQAPFNLKSPTLQLTVDF